MQTVTYYNEVSPSGRIQTDVPFDEFGATGRWKIETIQEHDYLGPPPGYDGEWKEDEPEVTLYIERRVWIFCFPFDTWVSEEDFFDRDEEVTINECRK